MFYRKHNESRSAAKPVSASVLGLTAKEVTLFSDHAHKGPNLSGLDPESGALVQLFHPRQDQWDEHFERNGVIIVGRTTIGRATVGLR